MEGNDMFRKKRICVRRGLRKKSKAILTQCLYRYDREDKLGKKTDAKYYWITPDLKLAKSYSHPELGIDVGKFYIVKINLKNPLVVDCQNNRYSNLYFGNCKFSRKFTKPESMMFANTNGIALRAKNEGFDGVIFLNVKENDRDISTTSICFFSLNSVENFVEINI